MISERRSASTRSKSFPKLARLRGAEITRLSFSMISGEAITSPNRNQTCKYPRAEPEALRLLAPQRGLIATGEKQKQLQQHKIDSTADLGKIKTNSARHTPGILKVWLPPRQSRGSPDRTRN